MTDVNDAGVSGMGGVKSPIAEISAIGGQEPIGVSQRQHPVVEFSTIGQVHVGVMDAEVSVPIISTPFKAEVSVLKSPIGGKGVEISTPSGEQSKLVTPSLNITQELAAKAVEAAAAAGLMEGQSQ